MAKIDDAVIGVGGKDLNATGRLIFAMQVTEAMLCNDYWSSAEYRDKRPVRNGSRRMTVGERLSLDGRRGLGTTRFAPQPTKEIIIQRQHQPVTRSIPPSTRSELPPFLPTARLKIA